MSVENRKITTEELERLIDEKSLKELREVFETVPSIDIAEAANEIEDVTKLVYIFKRVKSELTADFFTELDPEVKENLISKMSDAELARILETQFVDDLTDDIEDMPANLVSRILRNVDKETRSDINKLLNYKENTAGSIMTTEFLTINDTSTCDQAISKIRSVGRDKETVYTLFIMDSKRNLVGTLDLDDLIFADGSEIVSEIMNRDFVTVNTSTDQEEVANMVKRYDLNAIAVLNNENRLVGLITIDDIVDVIEQEATEDVQALSHVAPLEDSYLDTSSAKMALKCIPWIVVLLILGTFTTMALDKIEKANVFSVIAPVLIAFVPTLMDTGGNAGGQTIALMIRGLATKEFTPRDFWKVLLKEALTALIVSSVIACFAFLWFMMEQYTGIVTNDAIKVVVDGEEIFPTIWNGQCWYSGFFLNALKISGIVSITLFAGSFVSKIIAVCLPLGVAAVKKDPAIVAQPLLTTFVDVISLISYLGIASLLFKLFP